MNDLNLFDLDPSRLDTEWLRHSRDYHTWAVTLADREAEYHRAKARRSVVTAEIDREIRKDPASFGLVKVTEESVKHTIVLQAKFQAADNTVIDSKLQMDYAAAMVDALDVKKKALENLVQLDARDYFATPRTPVGATGAVMRQKEIDDAFSPNRKRQLTDDD